PQWRFRATSAEQILRIQDEFNGDSMQKNMNIFKAIARRQQGLAFNWNIGRSVISIDGFSIVVSSFIDGVYRNFKDVDAATNNSSVAALIPTFFCTLTTQWYFIRPVNRTGSEIDLGRATFNVCLFFEEAENGFKDFQPPSFGSSISRPKIPYHCWGTCRSQDRCHSWVVHYIGPSTSPKRWKDFLFVRLNKEIPLPGHEMSE
ncbi:uncharacterized protein C8R40DRAFT_1066555, partial [Lentinula edodes]|uniref:uncharacterized protein n=1 Tax=Lentinula edodes TaxID=5353 RepID=UPI001E8D8BF7